MWKKTWNDMRRKEGRYGKSLYENVSVRKPHTHYEELPKLLDANGEEIDPHEPPEDASDYTFKAKIVRTLLTRKNQIHDPVYLKENLYYVFFRCDPDYVDTIHEILWHKHVDKKGSDPTFEELLDTQEGVLTVESMETHRGQVRLVCQLYEMA